jgi:hypothetical protein
MLFNPGMLQLYLHRYDLGLNSRHLYLILAMVEIRGYVLLSNLYSCPLARLARYVVSSWNCIAFMPV